MKRSRFPLIVTLLVLLFFYLPIMVLVINSFNASRFGSGWEGFSLIWYRRLFDSPEIWRAVQNSLVIAFGATLLSLLLGTTAAFALHKYARSRLQRSHYLLIYTPLVVPEILTGISLLMFFVALGWELGLWTIFLSHVTFCISYVAMVVLARLQDFDYSIVEASQDLGRLADHSEKSASPYARPGSDRRGASGLHPFHRRFCHLLFRRRSRIDDPPDQDLQHDQTRFAAHDQRPFHSSFGNHLLRRRGEPAGW